MENITSNSNAKEIKIGELVRLEFIQNEGELKDLKALLKLQTKNNRFSLTNEELGKRTWIQVGENQRVFAEIDKISSTEILLQFGLSRLMALELSDGETLFAGVEHPNYNIRTQEIPLFISKSIQ